MCKLINTTMSEKCVHAIISSWAPTEVEHGPQSHHYTSNVLYYDALKKVQKQNKSIFQLN